MQPEWALVETVRWLHEALGCYPDQIGAPGGFAQPEYRVWAPRGLGFHEFSIALWDYRGQHGAWIYQLDGVWRAFTPQLVAKKMEVS
jgi:hypothetical protein